MTVQRFSLTTALGACIFAAMASATPVKAEGGRSVELILDASGSMRAQPIADCSQPDITHYSQNHEHVRV